MIYDVSAAYKPSPKGGWSAKRQKEEAVAVALTGTAPTDDAEEVDS